MLIAPRNGTATRARIDSKRSQVRITYCADHLNEAAVCSGLIVPCGKV